MSHAIVAACVTILAIVDPQPAEARKHLQGGRPIEHAHSRAAVGKMARHRLRVRPLAAKPAPHRIRVAATATDTATLQTGTPEKADGAPGTPRLLSREEILASLPERLERVGRHIVVGFNNFADLRPLVERRAIGGIFITDHNVRGKRTADVKAEIDKLQAIRAAQGLPRLVIAADQEGGNVSRLSPPLKRPPTLAQIISKLSSDQERQTAVTAYAEAQGEQLQRIGVTLNFAPVVDLKLVAPGRDDGATRLRMRAIAEDPYLVSKVGAWYCDGLAKAGIMCTLKHFPGLGRVLRDTHVAFGDVAASEGKLELNDWVPFRRIMARPNAATMLGHVFVGVIDKDLPASYSKPVIATLIRDRWQYDGILITDDFSMGAIIHSKSGTGGAAVKSLNAGTDFVLVSYLEAHYDPVMSALLSADENGSLDQTVRDKSRERIGRALDPESWRTSE